MQHSLRWQWFDHSEILPSLTWVCGVISCQDLNLTNLSINQKVTSFFLTNTFLILKLPTVSLRLPIWIDMHVSLLYSYMS